MTPVKFLAFGDLHCPLHDTDSVNWLLEKIAEHRPDYIVNLGDLFEADSASRWPSEYDFSLADEFEAANKILSDIRKVGGRKAEYVFLPGNHDENIIALNRIDPKLRGLCDYRRPGNVPELDHWQQPARYVYSRKSGSWRLGQIVFSHGYESGTSPGEYETLYMAYEYGLYVHGHTHRPHTVRQCMRTRAVPLRYWYANAGTLRQMDCDYMARKRQAMWGSAVVVGDCLPVKSPRIGRQWSAETIIHKMYDSE